jgi:hypothetical protein
MFPTEAGVNTNQSESPSQGHFKRIYQVRKKTAKTETSALKRQQTPPF